MPFCEHSLEVIVRSHKLSDELFVVFVTSAYAHANLLSVDASSAKTMPGVTAYVSHKDVPGSNNIGAIFPDEEVFAREKVI